MTNDHGKIVQLTIKDGKLYGCVWKEGVGGVGFVKPIKRVREDYSE